jgi:hypothetical protein
MKKITELEQQVQKIRRDLDFIMNAHNLFSNHDRVADLNERTRQAMQIIADDLSLPLSTLFEHKEGK